MNALPICHYRDEIVRAVLGDGAIGAVVANPVRLGQLATALAQTEAAKDVLCKNGYGSPEWSIDAMARQVPESSGCHKQGKQEQDNPQAEP